MQEVNDSSVSRVLTQQEVTEFTAVDTADYNVKSSRQLTRARPPMNRESTEQAGNGESRGSSQLT